MYKKKLILLIISVFFFIILIESGIRFILYLKSDTLFKTENHQTLYKKYSERLNHLRYMYPRPNKPDEYLLNELNGFDENLNTILIQGDSRTNQLNKFKDKDYLNQLGYNLINSGTSSYSPSNMSVQFDVINEHFDYKPKIVIALIDPTDLGDEICRYKEKIIYKNNKIWSIKKNQSVSEVYFLYNYFLMSEVNLSKKPKFFYLPKIIKYIFKYNLNFKKNCKFNEDIQSYLIKENEEGKEYFKFILTKYIENIQSYNFVEKIYLVSYPHIQHLDESYFNLKYKIKINDIIKEINLDEVNHIDLYENNVFKEYNKNYLKVFIKGDNASHLTDEGIDVFYKYIFDKVKKDNE